jgi:hypothetical protein
MNDDTDTMGARRFEERSRAVFQESVEGVDFGIRSRLTQARQAALDASAQAARRPWLLRLPLWTPAAGVAAALLVGVALWHGNLSNPSMTGDASDDDMDIVAASDGGSVDALDMLQEDLDFYDFANTSSNPEPAA